MIYTTELIIKANIDTVSMLFVDKNSMNQWEPGLKAIESTQGNLFEEGSEGDLVFQFGEHEMRMHVVVESDDLPNQITLIYQVPGAWNRCVNHFIPMSNQTKWVMDVEFRFDVEPNLSTDQFAEKTLHSMTLFKAFVEMEK